MNYFHLSEERIYLNEYSADLNIEINFFFGEFKPYFNLGKEGGILSVNYIVRGFFILKSEIGFKSFYKIQPFAGITLQKILPEINAAFRSGTESVSIRGIIGLLFLL